MPASLVKDMRTMNRFCFYIAGLACTTFSIIILQFSLLVFNIKSRTQFRQHDPLPRFIVPRYTLHDLSLF